MSQTFEPIFRFKFSPSVVEELHYFSKLHQYDDRKTFKESWNKWIRSPDISSLFEQEIERLLSLGSRGNILDKMFKSSRYYHKKVKSKEPTTKRRHHNKRLHKSFLRIIDTHIENRTRGLPPSAYFEDFCYKYRDEIIQELYYLMDDDCSAEKHMNKIKKTYKTRLFNCIA